jgi:hypothetical protein
MAQSVRVGEELSQRACVESSAAGGDEERVVGAARQLRPLAEPQGDPVRGFLAERDDPLLAALAADAKRFLVELDVGEVEIDSLLAPEACRVDELRECAVPDRERVAGSEPLQLGLDLLQLQPPAVDAAPAALSGNPAEAAEEGADGREPRDLTPRASLLGSPVPARCLSSGAIGEQAASTSRRVAFRARSQAPNSDRSTPWARRVESDSAGLAKKRSIAAWVSMQADSRP